jgi:DNA-directed RNA polymerase specialized sigma24 family protein
VVPAVAGSNLVAHLPVNPCKRSDSPCKRTGRSPATGNSLGTDAQATTAGTTAEAAGDEPPLRLRGDELDLYAAYHSKIARHVHTSRDNVEDACAFAWIQFLKHQPDRDRSWEGWLYRVAKNEAFRLTALERREAELVTSEDRPVELPDPRDRYAERLEFLSAVQKLKKLSPLHQETVMIRSQVSTQREVAEIMGLSRQRVAYLLTQAHMRVAELNEERHNSERPVASPRAARLRELEDDPPAWLKNAIGTRPGRSKSSSGVVLAWRRAALVLDDYRRASGNRSATDAIGAIPIDPAARRAYQRAERAIKEVADERWRRGHGLGR